MVEKFGPGDTAEVKKILPKPYLLFMGLMITLSDNLLYGVFLLTLLMLPQPHQRKPSPPQQLHLLIPIRKPIPKSFHLFITHIIRVLLLALPFYLDLLYGIRGLGLEATVALLGVVALLWAADSPDLFHLVGVLERGVEDAFLLVGGGKVRMRL